MMTEVINIETCTLLDGIATSFTELLKFWNVAGINTISSVAANIKLMNVGKAEKKPEIWAMEYSVGQRSEIGH